MVGTFHLIGYVGMIQDSARWKTATARILKLSPAQLDLLKQPHRIKKTNATVEKLVSLGLLELDSRDPRHPYYKRTKDGQEILDELAKGKSRLTVEEQRQIARMFQALHVRAEIDDELKTFPGVTLYMSDPEYGAKVLEKVDFVPTEAEAQRIVKNLRQELKEVIQETKKRWHHIPR